MPIPRKEIVQPILEKYRKPIVDAALGAWKDWIASQYLGRWRYKRSRANFVFEQFVERMHLVFDGSPDVRILEKYATSKFLLEDQILFRFKKGNEIGLSTNIPTQYALAFHDHKQDLLGLGLPEIQRVEIVYIPNMLETEISDLLVVARDNKKFFWTYSLLAPAEVEELPAPALGDEFATSTTRRLVHLRDTSETRKRDKKG